jgi:hypothetical protein
MSVHAQKYASKKLVTYGVHLLMDTFVKDFDDAEYYGWIKFTFDSSECRVEVLDTFLNPTASEHISVNE